MLYHILSKKSSKKSATYCRTLKLRFEDIVFNGYLDLLYYFIRNKRPLPATLFPHSETLFIKSILEAKFNRQFPIKEVRKIIRDKSWQWRTSSQLQS